MTEAIRTPSPAGLKRLVKVSTLQWGTKFVSIKLDSKTVLLVELIDGVLRGYGRTARELVACLLSEPYNVSHTDLDYIALALGNLNENGLLKVGFRVHNERFDIEPVFQTPLLGDRTHS